ncbi:voltage gated chloride channel-domain-containing protein [Chytriomyces sp. MP71]|nr:voltage gated chloride channel-domain-containing protein [Chytriomyces sp. MP71]
MASPSSVSTSPQSRMPSSSRMRISLLGTAIPNSPLRAQFNAVQVPTGSSSDNVIFLDNEDSLQRLSQIEKADEVTAMFRKYETIDFEAPDHPVLRLHFEGHTTMSRVLQDITQYILALFLVIVIAVLFLILSKSTEYFSELRLQQIRHYITSEKPWEATGFAIETALAAVLLPACLVVLIAPEAIGSGMTEVIAFLNGASSLHGITLKTLVIKYIGVIGVVSAGLFSGIDGPFAEIGAGLSILTVQRITNWVWFRRLFFAESLDLGTVDDVGDTAKRLGERGYNATTKRTHKKLADGLLGFLKKISTRLFATIGASVSIAVIFGAPIGGVLFAVEEASSFFELKLLIQLTFATIVGYLVVSFSNFEIENGGLFKNIVLNPTDAALFPLQSNCNLSMSVPIIFGYIVTGIIAALFGQLLNKVLSFIQRHRLRHFINPSIDEPIEGESTPSKVFIHRRKMVRKLLRVAEVAAIAILTAIVVVWIPRTADMDSCTPITTPLAHIADIVPHCAFFSQAGGLTCEALKICKETLLQEGVCYPTNTEKYFNNYVVETYEHYCSMGSDGAVTEHAERDEASLQGNVSAASFLFKFDPAALDLAELFLMNEQETCYFEVGTLFWISPERQLKLLLLRGVYNIWSVKSLAIFFLVYVLMGSITYYIALPTDLVVPNLIMGAAAGRMIGIFINVLKPGLVDPGAFALIGMAALWSGSSGLVLTVVAVVLEMTGDFAYLPALIVVTFTSAWVSSTIGPSLYHIEMENNGAPYLPAEPAKIFRTVPARKIATRENLVCLRVNESLSTIQASLKNTSYKGFPIVQGFSMRPSSPASPTLASASRHQSVDYRPIGFISRRRLTELLEEAQDEPPGTIVSLGAIASARPMTVREDTTASKVFLLFRQLGLKRVFIVDEAGFLTGLVMRSNLIREMEEEERDEEKKPKTILELAQELAERYNER